ncbi:PHC1 [Lepeophtheirus salmonis]|uniref:PHC1 n=1 Tax=Lepeophtheirus salmonis TaxID=72036 RepID=A0A7R8D4G4_LEPSM|nr:PHC1 [Lepeophtheirus salmonis]CAF3025294.1 PHC1 [Lepeophtheirus salmonis]
MDKSFCELQRLMKRLSNQSCSLPSALTQQSHIQSPWCHHQQQGQQQAGQQLSLAPPTLQPMSLSATNTAGTIRHVTTNSNNVSSQSGAPPGKTAISRALPTILPTTNVRPTYTLPQIPVSQASLQVNHQQQSSPKSKNKFSSRGGMGSSAGRQQPGKVNSSVGGATANSILKPSMVQQRATPPGTIMSSSPSPLAMGPPILSQQQPPVNSQSQPPVNSHSQPPTLQPMLTVASGGVSTTRTQLHSQYPSLITSAPSPSSGASATVLVSTSSSTLSSTKVLSTSSTASKSKTSSGNNNTLIKAKPPTSTPPPVTSVLNTSTTNGVTESGSVNNGTSGGRDTPKAFVKPNVLTHVIDGHIIQESSQPFPLEAGDDKAQNPGGVPKKEFSTEESFSHKHNSSSNSISSPATTGTCVVSLSVSSGSSSTPIMTTTTATTSTKSSTSSTNSSVTTGTTTHAEKKRGPGRPSGSTRQNIDNQRNPGSGNNQSSKGNSHHIKDGSGPPSEKRRKLTDDPIIKPPPLPTSNSVFGKNGNPLKWSVQQVCDFVKSLHGCAEYVEDFMLQEIDGQALMLLKTEHLMAAMSIKLGPALKICSAINEMLTFKLGSTTVGQADLVEESEKDQYYIKDDDARQR